VYRSALELGCGLGVLLQTELEFSSECVSYK